jgi:predicted MPP superfamily phosphohydrolase
VQILNERNKKVNMLKIAVISDLHCKHSKTDTNDDTWLLSDKMRKPSNQHPIQSLISTIEKEDIKADIVLCPGDITNKTDPQGLVTGWSFLEEIKERLGAKYLIASLGNHDVDSHGIYNKYDHLDMSRKLKNNYPFDFNDEKKAFIADRFCLIRIDDSLIFNFNSVHSHSNSADALGSIISDDILEMLELELKKLDKGYKYKIGLTHHHPIKHSNVGFAYKDTDVIEKGDKLLEILDANDFQIFIHGHKHEPKITNFNGIPVFASGSFSSIMNLKETGSNNCFHIVTLNENDKKGKIFNWEFTYGSGWHLAKNAKVSASSGFGFRGDTSEYCIRVNEFYTKQQKDRLTDVEFLKEFSDFQYFIPVDQEKVINTLSKDYKFEFIADYTSGILKEIIKSK